MTIAAVVIALLVGVAWGVAEALPLVRAAMDEHRHDPEGT